VAGAGARQDKARRLFDKWNAGQVELIAPALLIGELASMLWKRVTRGFMVGAEVLRLLQDFLELGLKLTPIETLARAALELSITHRHPFYDCLYVALAANEDCHMMTADQGFFKALYPVYRGYGCWWIGVSNESVSGISHPMCGEEGGVRS
jgi:predicted nucleic acid-binding protein